MEDFYKILGVRWNANDEQIARAYRALVRIYHPDVNQEPGAYEKFQEIQRAFEVLSNPTKRAAFNQARNATFRSMPNKRRRIPKNILSDGFLSARFKLILANVICFILMILLAALVFLINSEPVISKTTGELITFAKLYPKALEITVEFVVLPFVVIILCLNVGYFATRTKYPR